MAIAIAREDEEDVLADEMELARCERISFLRLWQGDNPLSDKRRLRSEGAGDIERDQTGVARSGLVIAAILDGC